MLHGKGGGNRESSGTFMFNTNYCEIEIRVEQGKVIKILNIMKQ